MQVSRDKKTSAPIYNLVLNQQTYPPKPFI